MLTTAPVPTPTAPATPPPSFLGMREMFLWDIRGEKRINKGKGERDVLEE